MVLTKEIYNKETDILKKLYLKRIQQPEWYQENSEKWNNKVEEIYHIISLDFGKLESSQLKKLSANEKDAYNNTLNDWFSLFYQLWDFFRKNKNQNTEIYSMDPELTDKFQKALVSQMWLCIEQYVHKIWHTLSHFSKKETEEDYCHNCFKVFVDKLPNYDPVCKITTYLTKPFQGTYFSSISDENNLTGHEAQMATRVKRIDNKYKQEGIPLDFETLREELSGVDPLTNEKKYLKIETVKNAVNAAKRKYVSLWNEEGDETEASRIELKSNLPTPEQMVLSEELENALIRVLESFQGKDEICAIVWCLATGYWEYLSEDIIAAIEVKEPSSYQKTSGQEMKYTHIAQLLLSIPRFQTDEYNIKPSTISKSFNKAFLKIQLALSEFNPKFRHLKSELLNKVKFTLADDDVEIEDEDFGEWYATSEMQDFNRLLKRFCKGNSLYAS